MTIKRFEYKLLDEINGNKIYNVYFEDNLICERFVQCNGTVKGDTYFREINGDTYKIDNGLVLIHRNNYEVGGN